MKLSISKTGILYKHSNKLDSDKKVEISKNISHFLFAECEIEEGVTLKDIFLLMKKDLKNLDAIIGNYCKEFVEEGLTPLKTKNVDIVKGGKKSVLESKSDIDYLELYWGLYVNSDPETASFTLDGSIFPSFHGIGIAKKNNSYGTPEGEKINFGLDFSKANSLAKHPIKLNNEASIFNDFDDQTSNMKKFNLKYSLGHILYGIIWELSFYGNPSKRNVKNAELLKSVNEIEEELDDE